MKEEKNYHEAVIEIYELQDSKDIPPPPPLNMHAGGGGGMYF